MDISSIEITSSVMIVFAFDMNSTDVNGKFLRCYDGTKKLGSELTDHKLSHPSCNEQATSCKSFSAKSVASVFEVALISLSSELRVTICLISTKSNCLPSFTYYVFVS